MENDSIYHPRGVTDDQIIECIRDGLTNKEAAAKLGIHFRSYQKRKTSLARKGLSPEHDMTRMVPDGYLVKGVSTYYNKEGVPSGQWVKSSIDQERQRQLFEESVAAVSEDIPRETPVPAPTTALRGDLMNVYVITDFHIGARSWPDETGAPWDMQIAEDTLVKWFGSAIALSPPSRFGVFAQLGDMAHFDGIMAVTPTSGHVLDADTRFQKLVRVTIRVIRRVMSMLLEKHEFVHLLCAEGNHDLASSAWLRELFAALYADEPRVTVETRPDPYYCIEFGKTSLFWHHGHKKKFKEIESVFVAKFREVFGRTKYSYAHMGHFHHDVVQETNTMKLEQHRTLAAPDSHASRGGWMSGRDAKVITYSKEYGEVSRQIISVDMLESDKV